MMEGEMSRRVELTRVYHFSAAHCLAHPGLSAADNATLYGQCARPHGHNYYLEVTVAACPIPHRHGGGSRRPRPDGGAMLLTRSTTIA
jgi:hypothetical protein